MHTLAERYAQLGEEARLTNMSEIMNFRRNQSETTDDLINRFEVVRAFALPIRLGCSSHYRRTCGFCSKL